MTAAYPVNERIVQTIVSRLQTVNIDNGYNVNIASVNRPTRIQTSLVPTVDLEAVVIQGDPTWNEEHSTEGNPRSFAWDVPIHIILFRIPSEGDTTPIDQYINVFRADCEKALKAPANWQQFADGAVSPETHLAINSWISNVANIPDSDGSYDGCILEYTVTYRTPETDPYTVG